MRRQEEFMDKVSQRFPAQTHNARPRRIRQSRLRSPTRRAGNYRRRSRSPVTRRASFRPTASSAYRQDKLPACPICLGRHRHHTTSCQATKTWNGKEPICTRSPSGRILNKRGSAICSDWQRPNRCADSSGQHIHECSGCNSQEHGADSCPAAQP